jgi:hypothetical protein
MNFLMMQLSPLPVTSSLFGPVPKHYVPPLMVNPYSYILIFHFLDTRREEKRFWVDANL